MSFHLLAKSSSVSSDCPYLQNMVHYTFGTLYPQPATTLDVLMACRKPQPRYRKCKSVYRTGFVSTCSCIVYLDLAMWLSCRPFFTNVCDGSFAPSKS